MADEARYEEQFTAFIDFLGFSSVSIGVDEATRLLILRLLLALTALRAEFKAEITETEHSKATKIVPAISTFSDHIVISYPTIRLATDTNSDELTTSIMILSFFTGLLKRIAAAALRIGFLIRGGATIGQLFHSQGVVFGEALIEAYEIESSTSVYPRVVLSPTITARPSWMQKAFGVEKSEDGLFHFNYIRTLLFAAGPTSQDFSASARTWFLEVVPIISRNLEDLERAGKLKELSKWAWFAREFREGLEGINPKILESLGISTDSIPWKSY